MANLIKEKALPMLKQAKTYWKTPPQGKYMPFKEIFCNQAEKEGFVWADGRRVKSVEFDNIVALNNDMSFNYIGFVGHIGFVNSEDITHYKIDFAKYINGAEAYYYKKRPPHPKSENEKSSFQRTRIFGRSDRSRTCGILLPKQARYHLRYTPIFSCCFTTQPTYFKT